MNSKPVTVLQINFMTCSRLCVQRLCVRALFVLVPLLRNFATSPYHSRGRVLHALVSDARTPPDGAVRASRAQGVRVDERATRGFPHARNGVGVTWLPAPSRPDLARSKLGNFS